MIFLFGQGFRPKCFFGPTKITKPRPIGGDFQAFSPCLIPGFPPDPLSDALWLSSDEPQHFQLQGVFSRHETFRCGAFCGEGSRQGGEDDLGDVVFFWLWLGIIWISLWGKETELLTPRSGAIVSQRRVPTGKWMETII